MENVPADRRKEKNREVKKAITDAFFRLMKDRPISSLTITEIVREAGVARVTYYRNFRSKEDILSTLIDDVLEEFDRTVREKGCPPYSFEHALTGFLTMEKYKDYIRAFIDHRLGSMIIERVNYYHEMIDGAMVSTSIERYRIYAYVGALLNMAQMWILGGTRETPEEMASQLIRIPWLTA